MKTLTIFTPTYNRRHTILRTYASLCRQTSQDFDWLIIDDGSCDGTREWVENLGNKLQPEGESYDWMGRALPKKDKNHFVIESHPISIKIEYIYKPNGGLYTGYNVAYAAIQTELCVCIDSDDYMPDDAVETIINLWRKHYPKGYVNSFKSVINNKEYCGILGLDFDINSMQPIGGYFPSNMEEANMLDLESRKLHSGDTKQVMRTDLMKKVSPMIGFYGEKNFNPFYMLMQVCDIYPMLVINDNLCTVEYQIGSDSMSQGIYKQYVNSPNSYARYRAKTMQLTHTTWRRRFILAIHYVSSCIIAKDKNWIKKSPSPVLTILVSPLGFILHLYIIKKAGK